MAALADWPAPPEVNSAALARDLKGTLRGAVRFDPGGRALYALDGSIYRQVPLGVVLPRTIEEIVQAVAICRHHGAPVFMRGGGTGLAGQTCNFAVLIDCSRHLTRVLELHPHRHWARVEPGCVLDDLRDAAERHHLTFAPDPATHNRCTLGGMIGNNSCGVHSIMGGKTVDNVEELEVLLYDGTRLTLGGRAPRARSGREQAIYAGLESIRDRYGALVRERYPNIPRRVSGYNLDQLLPEYGFHIARALVGSESTCAIVLSAKLRLLPSPRARPLLVLGYPDVYTAGDHVCELLETGPIGLEGFDGLLLRYYQGRRELRGSMELLPPGGGWLLAEYGADRMPEAEAQARAAMARLARQKHPPAMRLYTDPQQVRLVWKVREGGVGVTSFQPEGKIAWAGWEDSAVPPDRLGDYLRPLRQLLDRFQLHGSIFGHFGQACLHMRLDFNLRTVEGIRQFRRFMEEAADLVVSFGGSLSGEHGDGQVRAELLPRMLGSDLVHGLEEFKDLWDPDGKMNPGKMVRPYPLDAYLRLGAGYRPSQPKTHFQYPEDRGSFADATLRCQGLGVCRRHSEGVMCPSYMVTREEEHSTRGRAHLLWEAMQGSLLTGGWRDPNVKEALDLCLACKGCKRDCPVNVDMATYKAEFLAHYYEGRLRPRAAYAMGEIRRWAELAAHAPGFANFVARTPPLAQAAKLAAGVSQRRTLPAFAPVSFTRWFQRQPPAAAPGPRVVLFPDTFNDFFHPQVAQAAVGVLRAAGCDLVLPSAPLCCGRPLYDYGLLENAKQHLRRVLDVLRPEIAAGTPVLVLEPSCAAVFRDELVNLFSHDEDARRLSRQTVTLPELLEQLPGYEPPRFPGGAVRALVQIHCHQHALLHSELEASLLTRMGAILDPLVAGCCGMAGSFGFERAKYKLSSAIGERHLLPAVRGASAQTLIVADGFSCREQIRQRTRRRGLHLAQVLVLAARREALPARPERLLPQPVASRAPYLGAAAAVAAGLAAWYFRRA